MTTGAVVSFTVKVVVVVAVLPAPPLLLEPSFAVNVIVCVPGPTTVPAAGLCDTVIGSRSWQAWLSSELAHAQLSETVAEAVKSGITAWQLASADTVCGDAEITGGVTSFTTIIWVHVALPARAASSSSGVAYGPGVVCEKAVQVIVVVPVENGSSVVFRVQLPLESQSYNDLPSLRVPTTVTLSPVVVGLPTATAASQFALALTSKFVGQLIVGGLVPVSSTVTVNVQLAPPVPDSSSRA